MINVVIDNLQYKKQMIKYIYRHLVICQEKN